MARHTDVKPAALIFAVLCLAACAGTRARPPVVTPPVHAAASPEPSPTPVNPADVFQHPLPTWSPHCLGFGSEWRYCDGTPLRSCPNGAVWLHTGVDISTGIKPVIAAGDGEIAGYTVDPVFHGGALVRHHTTSGVYLTQYWHVWIRPEFKVGTPLKRGQAFADIADMGSKTHFHFAVFQGDFESKAWSGALPPAACSGFPAFPYHFIDPNAFLDARSPQSYDRLGRSQRSASATVMPLRRA